MAAQNEERAFAFYANIAAKAPDAEVRTMPRRWLARNWITSSCCGWSAGGRGAGSIAASHRERATDIPADLGSFERRVHDAGGPWWAAGGAW
jgi:hypothetical protein